MAPLPSSARASHAPSPSLSLLPLPLPPTAPSLPLSPCVFLHLVTDPRTSEQQHPEPQATTSL